MRKRKFLRTSRKVIIRLEKKRNRETEKDWMKLRRKEKWLLK